MEHQQYKTVKSFWSLLATVMFVLSAVWRFGLYLLGYFFWWVDLVFYVLLIGSFVVDFTKCRCPYCHSIKVTGCYHAKGSMEQCPKCKHLIYYD